MFVLVDGSIADIYIFPMLYFWQVSPTFIMFPGNLSNSSYCLDLRISLMQHGRIITIFFLWWCNIMIKLCWFSPRECFDVNSSTLILSVNFFSVHSSRYTILKQCNIAFFRDDSISTGVFNPLKRSGCLQCFQDQSLIVEVKSVDIYSDSLHWCF